MRLSLRVLSALVLASTSLVTADVYGQAPQPITRSSTLPPTTSPVPSRPAATPPDVNTLTQQSIIRSSTLPPATSPVPSRPATLPAPTLPTTTGRLQAVEGVVESVQGSKMTVKLENGQKVVVDMSQVTNHAPQLATVGEKITVLGTAGAKPETFDARYVQPSASGGPGVPRESPIVGGQGSPAAGGQGPATVAGQSPSAAGGQAPATVPGPSPSAPGSQPPAATRSPTRTPVSQDDCKGGAWTTFNSPYFKNLDDCLSYVDTQK